MRLPIPDSGEPIIFTLCLSQPGLTQSSRPAYVPEDAVLAVISDPEGQTNVRAAASAKSRIVATIPDGERFWALPEGDWRRVWLAIGENGFMHKSKVRVVSAGANSKRRIGWFEVYYRTIEGFDGRKHLGNWTYDSTMQSMNEARARMTELLQEESNRQVKIVSEQNAERPIAERQTEERQAKGRQSERRQSDWTNVRDKLLIEALKTVLPSGNR
jgi:hypothetical protein